MNIKLDKPPEGFSENAEYRVPIYGEYYLSDHIRDSDASYYPIKLDHCHYCPTKIVLTKINPDYKWPEFLNGWGFVKERYNNELSYYYEPASLDTLGRWYGYCINVEELLRYVDFKPPIINDYRIPVLNPNYKIKDKK